MGEKVCFYKVTKPRQQASTVELVTTKARLKAAKVPLDGTIDEEAQ